MPTHEQARDLAEQALQSVFPNETIDGNEVAALAGIACLETSYGAGWRGAGKGSNNMGAIQAGRSWKGETFVYTDTHPTKDGKNVPYRIAFRKYPTPLAGWIDLVKVAYINRGRSSVRDAARAGDLLGVSRALHKTGYYEGFGRTVADRIRNHHRALAKAVARADKTTTPTLPVSELPPTVHFGSTGDAVKLLQQELQISADGIFGRETLATLRGYQRKHGLVVDGWCGPKTWTALFGDDYTP